VQEVAAYGGDPGEGAVGALEGSVRAVDDALDARGGAVDGRERLDEGGVT